MALILIYWNYLSLYIWFSLLRPRCILREKILPQLLFLYFQSLIEFLAYSWHSVIRTRLNPWNCLWLSYQSLDLGINKTLIADLDPLWIPMTCIWKLKMKLRIVVFNFRVKRTVTYIEYKKISIDHYVNSTGAAFFVCSFYGFIPSV